ncbi:MAG: hypothetical protein F6J95_024665 [Leptolyngbya sp. SIO1E4]|nr:hypothetical protein [Leptolyngbya sp. SIO1E4]
MARHRPALMAEIASKTASSPPPATAPNKLKSQLKVATLASQIHACLSLNILGIQPQAAVSLSAGESNALIALGVWSDMQGLLNDIERSRMYQRHLAGEFRAARTYWGLTSEEPLDFCTWIVLATPDAVRAAIGSRQRVYLTIINADQECVIAGERGQCQQVIQSLPKGTAIPLDFNLCCHCPPLTPFRDVWWQMHHRPITPNDSVRIYANHLGRAYDHLDSDVIADALTGQALETVDFPRTVRQSWDDGVRIYLEHGPRDRLTIAIDKILHDKPHLALALDYPQEPVQQIYRVASALWAAGIDIDLARLHRQAARALHRARREPTVLSLPLYPPPVPLDFILAAASPTQAEPSPPAASIQPAEPPTPIPATQGVKRLMPPPPLSQEVLQVSRSEQFPYQPAPKIQPHPVRTQPPPPALPPVWEGLQQVKTVHMAYLMQQQQAQQTLLQLSQQISQQIWQQAWGSAAPLTPPLPATASPPPPAVSAAIAQSRRDPTVRDLMAVELRRSGPAASALWEWPAMLELAKGKISHVFGPEFQAQDAYRVQVRLPEPPLLLCERVLAIDAEPKSMGTGTIWTEHRVTPDRWYLHFGRMPSGIFIECGQADLTLISYLGVDFLNRGERVYRLLGCEITWLGAMPKIGDTLKYEIRVTGHAQQGEVRLFFFEYDCWIDGQIRAQVRNGQAGFFTPQELQETQGALWEPLPEHFRPHPTLLPPPCLTPKRAFSRDQVLAYTRGELWNCFGQPFAEAKTHHRSPRSEAGPLNFIQAVTHFDPQDGPVGRGYLRAVQTITPQGCFMEGHFLHDPCMPGTLMANGCCQMMAFYLTALGFTLPRDGWRFEPKPNQTTTYICRSEVNPASQELVYEIFVDDIVAENGIITLYAHGVCTVDGLKALVAKNCALSLVPGCPGDGWPENAWATRDDRPLAYIDTLPLDYKSLMHCALGDPTQAFGPKAACYTGVVPPPRLPSPPYHFMSRITKLEGTIGQPTIGSKLELLYDIPPDAWYFKDNADPVMPFCVLTEIALQPCGWLFIYNLPAEAPAQRRLFRNLDVEGQVHRAVRPSDRTIRTAAELISYSEIGAMIIAKFAVHCYVESEIVFALGTASGLFPPSAFEHQKGIDVQPEERAVLEAPANIDLDLRSFPKAYFGKGGKLPAGKLLMLDRVTGYWPNGGKAGKGQWRAEKSVDPGDWYFKAHFYSDPVQPGSLGVEAILQLIQLHMLHRKMDAGLSHPCFLPGLPDCQTEWHCRGQVAPNNDSVIFDIEILAEGTCENGRYVEAEGRLWLNGGKFYHLPKIGMRLVDRAKF